MRQFKYLVVGLLFSFIGIVYADSSSVSNVLNLVNQRFELAQKIAAYKYRNTIPVIIPVRDRVILTATLTYAYQLGFDVATVRTYIVQQLHLAQQVELTCMNNWKQNNVMPDPGKYQSIEQTQLDVLKKNVEILAAIKKAVPDLEDASLADSIRAQTQELVTQKFLTKDDKAQLANAFIQIRMSPTPPAPIPNTKPTPVPG
ncbi:MAG: chorismate mutase [Gammaproteobacteria bacterium]|nr:chorismate mutase [Gammaproteobacteria bacterium]